MAAKKGKRETKLIQLRIPTDIKAWLDRKAREEYGTTVTSKVIRCLAAEMQREQRETERAS